MKKKLVIKYEGKKHFVAYGDVIVGEIGVDKYKMLAFNSDYFEKNPALKEAYDECKKILAKAIEVEINE